MRKMVEKKNLVLTAVLIGMLMSAIDTTIVIIALPTISAGLNAPFIDTIWVILIYLLVLASFTTLFGRFGDIIGRGKIFNTGFLIFIVGSALSGAAPNVYFLIGARAFQGFGAVMIQANSSAIVADNFEPHERGKAFGYTSMGWTIGGVLGILLGGIITSYIGWRYIFYINVPVGLFGFYYSLKYIKDSRKRETSIDYAGNTLMVAILLLIAYGGVEIAGNGISLLYLLMIAAGLLLIIPFVYVENRVKNPLISMQAFKVRVLSFSLMASLLQAIGYLSVLFILIMYLQGVRGYSPLDSSLLLVPGYIVSSMFAPKMGKIADRHGTGLVATIGIAVMDLGILIYLLLGVNTPIYVVVVGSLVSGFGGSMFWPSNNSAVMSGATKELYGSISGLLRMLSNIGTLMSYIIAISIASLSVSRYVAFEVFLGTTQLQGGISAKFVTGIHAALLASFVILFIAGVFSSVRGKTDHERKRSEAAATESA
ncbi:MAG: MFS transporter [Candidatus Thermoplasmatota archaeon]|jgi:EmrB/QacA subfamily drug resistance transporter|nr:MFS transporter [Candidatus Thermoplasmatota archaeon]MCL5790828.1 MFS transporter [Candidatus Thermoplasmatota archaeon]